LTLGEGQDTTDVAQAARPPVPLSHWLCLSSARTPEATALEAPEATMSYATLNAAVQRLAERLRTVGIGAGDRIAIAATRSAATIVAILATLEAEAAYVPLDLGYPADRLRAMLDDTQPRLVLGERQALEQLGTALGEFPTLERPAPRGEALHGSAADLTYVLFTSGSTGRPKGVAMGSRPLRHLIEWHARHPQLGKPARTLQFAPLSFDVHFQEILSTLACGGTLVVLPEAQRRDPAALHAALIERRIERVFVPYVALQMIADAARDEAPPALRDVVSAGEQLQVTPAIRSLFTRLPGAELHNHYGPTESHVVTAHELRGDAAAWPDIPPIGRPLPHVEIALRDVDGGHHIDGAGCGELLLGGDTLAHGYLGRPELTAERFVDNSPGMPGRWYATGDLVRRDADGICSYLGRADAQLKVDGFRIEPGEIELALMANADLKDAVVTAPELPGVGKQLVAHVVPRSTPPDTAAMAARLRAALRGRLPEYMVPTRIVMLERLPTTPSGKIDRRNLPLPRTAAEPPTRDPLELARSLWQDLLGAPRIGNDDNLFDLGVRSLLVLRFVARMQALGVEGVSVADVYDRPTVAGIAAVMRGEPRRLNRDSRLRVRRDSAGIAIVGMATRTAGAGDVEAFWADLRAGREGIRHFAPHELDPSIPPSVRERPNFVAARGVLEDADRFDAAFFGITPREAVLLDPQQRLLLELCWSALEHAAIDPSRSDQRIGVYAGTANNSYAAALRAEQPELVQQAGEFATMLASEKDYAATRVANRLNLNGPAISIHTACSTGLVAVAQAWHALASGQCDVALAGGATVLVPQHGGYLHVEGAMESADGHCRPFDADASGTVFASGGAVVVLKRLEDALATGDTVYAVIRGVGLNNDGGDKASFTAPSVSGQAAAIRMALDHAGVDARSIGYVEAHGTATALGDPIEVAALTRAWRDDTPDVGYCGIGSLKSNLGHLIAAAGVAGLVKAALALQREVIPATLHYRRPNPQIDFAATPFRVVAQHTPWPRGEAPRRAAVSSFGVGGTNAHAVIEEAPPAPRRDADDARLLVLPLSARSAEDVVQRARDLADRIESDDSLPLADVAATLMRGRKAMAQRLAVVTRDRAAAVTALRAAMQASTASAAPRTVFLFPGQGSQHPGMARGLYNEAPAFREALDRCLDAAPAPLSATLRDALLNADGGDAEAADRLAETRHAQPALFAMSYALAAWLDSLSVQADAMIGHSVGEYAAACLAGVMSVEHAMVAVVARGAAMFEQPRGAMLAVHAGVDALRAALPPAVELAAINAPNATVVAGTSERIDAYAEALDGRGIDSTRLKVSHAFHSASMDGAVSAVEAALGGVALQAPQRPLYSCVSGEPLSPRDATDASYWARQMRAPVQFSRAVQAELANAETVFVEVGPGQALSTLLRQHPTPQGAMPRVVALLGPAHAPGDAAATAFDAVARLWCAGVDIAWPVPANARRAALPTYPFRGERYWFARRAAAVVGAVSAIPSLPASSAPALSSESTDVMSRLPRLEQELKRVVCEVSGLADNEVRHDATFVELGLDSLALTQATLEIERVFGIKLRFRRLLEDLDNIDKLVAHLHGGLPADRFAPPPAAAPAPAQPSAAAPALAGSELQRLIQQQMQLMSQQLALLSAASGVPAAHPSATAAEARPAAVELAAPPAVQTLVDKPFGASARITLERQHDLNPAQRQWLDAFIVRYNARTAKSKAFSQQHRKLMADPRVVTGFNPLWKDLVYPIVADRSDGARVWDLDGNAYIDLLSCFGANLLGYQPPRVVQAAVEQLHKGVEVGPQHPLAAEVSQLIAELTGLERVAFCNTGSEAVMGAMRIARTVTGRKTIAIFTNSYHGIFDEVIVRGTKQLRSVAAAPGILANAVEHVFVLDYASDESLRVLRERGRELAAIMIEPIQNKVPTLQPREFVQALRGLADDVGCALIFDEMVTGFRVAPGGAQEWYGVRGDIATYGKIIGGGMPLAAIAGSARWMDALDGGHWQYGDDSYPEAGVTYFAGTFVRHPLALAASRAMLLELKRGGRELYRTLNERTQRLIDRLNTAFVVRGAPVRAVHCASLWRLAWDDGQKYVGLFYYVARLHGLHLYEQFGHFVTSAMGDVESDRIFEVFTQALDELMALGFIVPRAGAAPPLARPLPAEAPLAPGQTERWLAASYDAAARRALNESFCVSLAGGVDVDALKTALHDVLVRHDAFRVRFDVDRPQQSLAPAAPFDIADVDLRDRADADAALDAFCSEASRRDFSLDRAPLAAASLLRLADGRIVVHVVASHLIFDGWASSVFSAELAVAYRARCNGVAPGFAPAESPLVFAAAEQQRFNGVEGQQSLAYWRQALRDVPRPLLLGDLEPPQPRCYAADTVRTAFEGELFHGLRAVARESGATLFQVLLAAVAALLHRQSGQREFVVSIPYASQGLSRHGPLLADGVLDLPLKLDCDASDSGSSLLGRVRERLFDALEHPLATQGAIARALGIASSGNRPPLTGVFYNLNPRIDLSGFAPLVATMHEGRKRGTLAELFFNFYEQADVLTLDLHYSADFFSAARAQTLVDALKAVCEQLARSPSAPLGAAPMQSAVADTRLQQWNATSTPLESGARVEQWIARQAAATPDAVAIEARSAVLRYRDVEARANRIAHVLRLRGIGSGALVGLCLGRGPDLIPALLGVLKSGAAYVPLDPGFPTERLHSMAQDAGLALLITESAHADRSGLPREAQLRLDDDAASIAAAAETAPPAPDASDAPAYVIYTSGSTGRPKGVVVPQRAVCNFLASMRREPGMHAADRLLAVTTLSFDIAVLELLLPLVSGARVVIAEREDAMDGEALARLIASHGIGVMQATPTTWHLLLDAGWRAPRGFRALCGGEALPPSLAAKLLEQDIELWNLYGPTETTVWSTLARVRADDKVVIGRPIANTQVWIVDDAMRPRAVGIEGEICIGGAGVALGYHQRPELTAERFVADPFVPGGRVYRTGDLGLWRDDGTLEHRGRLDSQVKLRGYRIELGEIEARLAQLPGVSRNVVVAREDRPGDPALVAYVVADGAVSEAAMRDALCAALPDYMIPRHIVALERLPLLPNGKIDRKALPAPADVETPSVETLQQAAATDLECTVAAAMSTLLGRKTIGLQDNFFELGGHSLLAARLSAMLFESVGQRPGLRAIFEAPTPAGLAAALAAVRAAPSAATATGAIAVRPDQSTAPLSQMQQRVWFLENLTPGTVVHSIPTGHRFTGPLDIEAFDRAFQLLIARQSVLRTVIERSADGDRQRVLPELPFGLLPLEDLSALPEAERKPAMARSIAQLVEIPYDLERGPLFTAKLYRLSPEEHGLLFQAHHLIWDAWSFDILYGDLSELYDACRSQREPKLPAITVSYSDFAEWHNAWMSGAELARQTRYWRDKLTPLPPAIELPLDRPRPADMSGRGGSHQFNLDAQATQALHELSRRHGRTIYVTLLSAYALLLHRLSGQDDFVVGTPVRGREQPALEPLMGFFVNMLPMRMRFDASLRMGQWLERVQHEVVESFSCPDVPFEHLVRELKVPRDNSRPPIHQVSFSYQDVRERPTRWGNVEHQRMPTPMLGAAQELSLWCVETRNHVEFVFTFNADILDATTVKRIAERLESLLHQIVAEPDRALSEYRVCTDAEQALLASWNATAVDHGVASCVHRLVEAQVTRTPQAVAVVQPGTGRLTYAELDSRANRVARLLRTRGIGRGALVGICIERGIDMVVAQLACLKAGAAYVPLDPAYPAERLTGMAADSQLALLLTESSLVHVIDWPRERSVRLDIDAMAIAAQSDSTLAAELDLDARADDPAYVIYTSGSTGVPKGVVVPHRAVTNFLASMAREPGFAAGDRLLAVTTLSFDIAVLELLLPLSVGACTIVADREQALDADALAALIDGHGVNVMQATPSTWRMLVDAGWRGTDGFKALVGGEALRQDLAEQLLARTTELWNMYGPTETTVWSTCWRVDRPERGIAIGRPIANTQVHVLDARGEPCPIGVPGEIHIGGAGVALGYLRRPELTAERFIADGTVYRTGDLGRWHEDGQLEHLGRLDFQVKVRGHRIELGEIETNLASHPQLAQAVVIVREDQPGDARLVAYIVGKGVLPTAHELREALRRRLPDYMVPQHFVPLDAVPLLPNGKIDRHMLPAPDAGSAERRHDAHFTPPSTEQEIAIARIWSGLLGIDEISTTDNFFDLGGHSLLAMRAITDIERELGVRLGVRRLIFETLAQISITSSDGPAQPRLETKPRGWLDRVIGALRS
jgi:amino acid adenylation domain-containing protein